MVTSSNGNNLPRYWPLVRGIHRSPVNSPHKGQSRGALMFSLICVWINGWVNSGEAGDLRRYRAQYNVTVMIVHVQHIYYLRGSCHYQTYNLKLICSVQWLLESTILLPFYGWNARCQNAFLLAIGVAYQLFIWHFAWQVFYIRNIHWLGWFKYIPNTLKANLTLKLTLALQTIHAIEQVNHAVHADHEYNY